MAGGVVEKLQRSKRMQRAVIFAEPGETLTPDRFSRVRRPIVERSDGSIETYG
jgi:hypothetical protein